jgi:lysyl-tRNA synthetase class 2
MERCGTNETASAALPTWRRLSTGALSWKLLRLRSDILDRTRAFFRGRGFLEVDTPIALAYPNIDPNIYPVTIADASGRMGPFYLHTSPELSMKKLIAAGSGDIFSLGKVFRDREGSPLHCPEFTMLEWYRVGGSAGDVMRDVEDLFRELAFAVTGRQEIVREGMTIPLSGTWSRWELTDAFRGTLGVSATDEDGLRRALEALGHRPSPDEGWEALFFRAYVDVIEPALRAKGTCFLTGFPAALAAMAKRRTNDPSVSERFEGYVSGIELVNGYEELTDPAEQEARLVELAAAHRGKSGDTLPIDPDFLEALRLGMPPCSGAALGFDRLVMLLLGRDDIADASYR